jgi:hypothetical protein
LFSCYRGPEFDAEGGPQFDADYHQVPVGRQACRGQARQIGAGFQLVQHLGRFHAAAGNQRVKHIKAAVYRRHG